MIKGQDSAASIKAMMITAIIFSLIMVVMIFARQKVTNWLSLATLNVLTLSG